MINNTEIREEIVNKYVAMAHADFSNIKNVIFERERITRWLFDVSQELKEELGFFEINKIIDKAHANANNVLWREAPSLTVDELRKKIEGLPGNTRIAYQRIEDSFFQKGKGWKESAIPLVWESNKIDKEGVKWIEDNPSEEYRLKTIDGQNYMEEMSEYILAFSAYLHTDDNGQKVFVINAHY